MLNYVWLFISIIYILIIIKRIHNQSASTFFSDPIEIGDFLLKILGIIISILNMIILSMDFLEHSSKTNDHSHSQEEDYEKFKHITIVIRIILLMMAQLFVFKLFVLMKRMNQ